MENDAYSGEHDICPTSAVSTMPWHVADRTEYTVQDVDEHLPEPSDYVAVPPPLRATLPEDAAFDFTPGNQEPIKDVVEAITEAVVAAQSCYASVIAVCNDTSTVTSLDRLTETAKAQLKAMITLLQASATIKTQAETIEEQQRTNVAQQDEVRRLHDDLALLQHAHHQSQAAAAAAPGHHRAEEEKLQLRDEVRRLQLENQVLRGRHDLFRLAATDVLRLTTGS